jgi:hypothetical protein
MSLTMQIHFGRLIVLWAALFSLHSEAAKFGMLDGNRRSARRIVSKDPTEVRRHIYCFVGGPWDDWRKELASAVAKFEAAVTKADPLVKVKRLHNSQWDVLCEELRSEPPFDESRGEALILMGHSWGGQAVIDLALCVDDWGAKIPLAMTLDSSPKWGHDDPNVVPENIEKNFNYYQTNDLFFSGSSNRRLDGKSTGIVNEFLIPTKSTNPHNQLAEDLLVQKLFQDRVIEVLNSFSAKSKK